MLCRQYRNAFLIAVTMLAGKAGQAQAPQYNFRDLGDLGGGFSFATAVNNSGQVVGASYADDGSLGAFLYSNGRMSNLGNPGLSLPPDRGQATAYSINDSGQIVGHYQNFNALTGQGDGGSFLYSNDLLQIIPGGGTSINNAGQIVGGKTLYSNGVITNLNLINQDGAAEDINNHGQIVGYDLLNAFVYQNGVEQLLPSLPAPSQGAGANAINDNGQIVGGSNFDSQYGHAVLWQNGQVHDLGSFGAGSNAAAINNNGVIVGVSSYSIGNGTPFVYQNGQMYDLFAGSDWSGGEAFGINDSGQIVGYGLHNGHTHAFLATPLPSVSGTIHLDGIADPAASVPPEDLVFVLTPSNGGPSITRHPTLGAGGTFTLSYIPFGSYVLRASGTKWLQVSTSINVSTTGFSGLPLFLLGGDANGDNKVDIGDFGVLVNAYGGDTTIADSGYDPQADFNCDGVVDIGDFGILVNNYLLTGAP